MTSLARRRFAFALAALAVPSALAQGPRRRLGILGMNGKEGFFGGEREKILGALAKLGFVAGRNLEIEERYETQSPEVLAAKARELVALKPDVILTEGSIPTLLLKRATATIPIVTSVGDPVGAGFARDLRRPGGNITGLSQNREELAHKQVELLRLIRPKLATLVFLWEAPAPGVELMMKPTLETVRASGIKVESIAYPAGGLEKQLAELEKRGIDTVMAMFEGNEGMQSAIRHHIAVLATGVGPVDDGALLGLENDGTDDYLEVASTLDKILRGANPAEIPFASARRFRSAMNARTAAALGIAITPELRLRIDRFVE